MLGAYVCKVNKTIHFPAHVIYSGHYVTARTCISPPTPVRKYSQILFAPNRSLHNHAARLKPCCNWKAWAGSGRCSQALHDYTCTMLCWYMATTHALLCANTVCSLTLTLHSSLLQPCSTEPRFQGTFAFHRASSSWKRKVFEVVTSVADSWLI